MNTQEKLLDRARKLFAMSQDDSSPHEAEIAMNRLNKMLSEHDISIADLEKQTNQFDEIGAGEMGRMPTWYKWLAGAAANLTDTRSLINTTSNARNKNRKSQIFFQGMNGDSEIAMLMFDYLIDTMKKGCIEFVNNPDVNTAMDLEMGLITKTKIANDYKNGFAMAINQRAQKIKKERKKATQETANNSSGSNSLVVVKNTMIANHFGKLSRGKTSKVSAHGEGSFRAGERAGASTGLNTQIGGNQAKMIK